MGFVTGMFLIDAPASALNNLGAIPGERFDNSVGVKGISTREGFYPYVSGQAFKYWLRTTLEKGPFGWKAAPVYREEKIAYTDANPILWWDDDLFGYMRAPSKRESARAKREQEGPRENETETLETLTRTAPFRVSTLVSIAPVRVVNDFGVMARHEGDPVPHEHQFYRATLKGLMSLDLESSGRFWYKKKTGFLNLDEVRTKMAEEMGLEHNESDKSYSLKTDERLERIRTLFQGMACLDGGAKQSIHYTDVSPPYVMMCVTRGGNNIFSYVIGADSKGLPQFNQEAFEEVMRVYSDDILSPVFIGWTKGYMDEERKKAEHFLSEYPGEKVKLTHPREAFEMLDQALMENPEWLD